MRKRIAASLTLGVFLVGLTVAQVTSQDADEMTIAWAAARPVPSPLAASYWNGASSRIANLIGGGPAHVVSFQSPKFQVMVNDPAQDLGESVDISTQSETAVAGFGNIVVVTFNDSGQFPSTLPNGVPSFMGYSRSTDGGNTFTDLGPVPPFQILPCLIGINNGDPAVVADRAGNFYTAHLTTVATAGPCVQRPAGFGNVIGIHKSTDGGQTWGPAVYPAIPPAPITTGAKPNSSQDKELIAVDTSGGPFDGNVYVSWTSIGGTAWPAPTPNSPNPPILLSRSTNGGATFSVPVQVSPFGDANQGSEPAVGPNGEVYVAWFRISGTGTPAPGPAIMVAKSTNGGVSFGPAVEVTPVIPIGFSGAPVNARLKGNFRTNDFPRIDVNPVNGQVYIVYNANPAGPDGSDIYFTRSTDGGASWSTPVRLNQDRSENDQYFPDIAVNGDGVLEAIWYDQRLDPNNLKIDVFKVRSQDGGLSWGPDQRITQGSAFPAVGFDPVVNPNYMGDYLDIKAVTTSNGPGKAFLLSWGDFRRVIETIGGVRPDQDVVFAIDR